MNSLWQETFVSWRSNSSSSIPLTAIIQASPMGVQVSLLYYGSYLSLNVDKMAFLVDLPDSAIELIFFFIFCLHNPWYSSFEC